MAAFYYGLIFGGRKCLLATSQKRALTHAISLAVNYRLFSHGDVSTVVYVISCRNFWLQYRNIQDGGPNKHENVSNYMFNGKNDIIYVYLLFRMLELSMDGRFTRAFAVAVFRVNKAKTKFRSFFSQHRLLFRFMLPFFIVTCWYPITIKKRSLCETELVDYCSHMILNRHVSRLFLYVHVSGVVFF